MTARPAALVTLDLHGKNAYQARVAIDAALKQASSGGVYRLRLIHGYLRGTALSDMISTEYETHAQVLRVQKISPGVTELVLRELVAPKNS